VIGQQGLIVHRTADSLTGVNHTPIGAAGGVTSPVFDSRVSATFGHFAPYHAHLWTRTTAFGGAGASGLAPQIVPTVDETGKKLHVLGQSFIKTSEGRGVVWASGRTQGGAGIAHYAHVPGGYNPEGIPAFAAGVGLYTDEQFESLYAEAATVSPVTLIMVHLGTNNGDMSSPRFRAYLRQYLRRAIRAAQRYTNERVGVLLITPMPFIDSAGVDRTSSMATRRDDMFAVASEWPVADQISVVDLHQAILDREGAIAVWKDDLLIAEPGASPLYRLHIRPTADARLRVGLALRDAILKAAGLATETPQTIATRLTEKLPLTGRAASQTSVDALPTLTGLVVAIQDGLINEADGKAVLAAIADKIATDWVAGDASPLAIVAALKADAQFATMLARIDAAVSSVGSGDATAIANMVWLAATQNPASDYDADINDPDSPADPESILYQLVARVTEAKEAAQAGGGGATFPTDADDATLAPSRVAKMVRRGRSLRSEEPLQLRPGENGDNAPLVAASFASDLAGGGRVATVTSVTVLTTPAGAVVDSLTVVGAAKRHKAQARFVLAAADNATVGLYEVLVKVRYNDGSGGAEGVVEVAVGA
jgi:hypothetical protein